MKKGKMKQEQENNKTYCDDFTLNFHGAKVKQNGRNSAGVFLTPVELAEVSSIR